MFLHLMRNRRRLSIRYIPSDIVTFLRISTYEASSEMYAQHYHKGLKISN